jgi:IclR family transcriptional regulator, acetate operon repressor
MARVQSIERAFDVLGALGDGPLGVTGIADRVGLPKSTVARLLDELVAQGAVEQVQDGTDYRIGDRLVTLAAGRQPTRSLIALARPHLASLASATGEATGLSIPDGNQVHYVDQEDSPHPVSIRDWTGTRFPMHAVSAGIVILAHRRPDEVERYLAGPLERLTDATIVEPAALRERVARARVDGFSWTSGEVAEGITSVAAAVADESGEVIGAIHVHGPSYRFPDPEDASAARSVEVWVTATAAAIAGSLRRAG